MDLSTNETTLVTIPQFQAQIVAPHQLSVPSTDGCRFLDELSLFRGRVFYDNGRRPSLRQADGTFADIDAFDRVAFHVLVRAAGSIVACARIMLLTPDLSTSWATTMIGRSRFEAILDHFDAVRHCEAGRWAVAPEYRRFGLGRQIVLLCYHAVRHLGANGAFLLACTSQGQDRALCRFGARPVDGCPLISAPEFSERLRLLYFDGSNPSVALQRQISEAIERFQLDHMPTARYLM